MPSSTRSSTVSVPRFSKFDLESAVTRPRVLGGLVLFALFAAWNRGDPLAYGLFSFLLAANLLGWTLPWLTLRRVTATRTVAGQAHEGQIVTVEMQVANRGRLPRFALVLSDHTPAAPPEQRECEHALPVLPPGSSRVKSMEFECFKRGEYQIGPLELRSSFPLGLWTRRSVMPETVATLLVYPRLFPMRQLPLAANRHRRGTGMESAPRSRGTGDFVGLREYRRGDSPRFIHWPSSARHGELIVKEFEDIASPSVSLILDLQQGIDAGEERDTPLEYAVKIAASAANLCLQRGFEMELFCCGEQVHWIKPGRGAAQFAAVLDTLARVRADGALPYAEVIGQAAELMRPDVTAVLFFSDPVTNVDENLRAVSALLAARAFPLCMLMDRASFSHAGVRTKIEQLPIARELAGLGAYTRIVRRGDDLGGVFDA